MIINKHKTNKISELEEDIRLYQITIKEQKQALKKLREEHDELFINNRKVVQDNTKIKRKLDDVVNMVNAYITATKAYSGDNTYNLLENELNRILEGYLVGTTRLRRLYSTEIEQALKHKNLAACLFLLEKIQMDLEEDG